MTIKNLIIGVVGSLIAAGIAALFSYAFLRNKNVKRFLFSPFHRSLGKTLRNDPKRKLYELLSAGLEMTKASRVSILDSLEVALISRRRGYSKRLVKNWKLNRAYILLAGLASCFTALALERNNYCSLKKA